VEEFVEWVAKGRLQERAWASHFKLLDLAGTTHVRGEGGKADLDRKAGGAEGLYKVGIERRA
jgi:hypothetical protein